MSSKSTSRGSSEVAAAWSSLGDGEASTTKAHSMMLRSNVARTPSTWLCSEILSSDRMLPRPMICCSKDWSAWNCKKVVECVSNYTDWSKWAGISCMHADRTGEAGSIVSKSNYVSKENLKCTNAVGHVLLRMVGRWRVPSKLSVGCLSKFCFDFLPQRSYLRSPAESDGFVMVAIHHLICDLLLLYVFE